MPTGKRPGSSPRRGDPGDWFYTQEWRHSLPPAVPPGIRRARPVLVFANDSPLSGRIVQALRAEGRPLLVVLAGQKCERGGPDWFALRPGEAGDVVNLIDVLREERRLPADVVHLWALGPEDRRAGPVARFERARDGAFRSLFQLARALGGSADAPPTCIHVVTDGAQEVAGEGILAPLAALAHGACRVAARETPGLRLRCIDLYTLDAEAGWGEAVARRLLAEFVAEAPDEFLALRGRERLVPRLEPLRLPERSAGPTWLRERGTYLVTGGLGGIGLAIAEHLARRVRARLVLLDRRGLPPRDAWSTWIAQRGEIEPTSRRIRRIQAAEDLGAEVMVVAADASVSDALRAALGEARARFGAIHGAFHCASERDEAPLRWLEPGAADRVLATRVLGALALEDACADAVPDFLFFATSLAGAAGLPGQIAGAAADTCLASLAAERSATGRQTFCVGFGPWRDAGMAAERAHAFERGASARPGSPLSHPLLRRHVGAIYGEDVLLGELSAGQSWLLSEHRLLDGTALLPAAAHLELALAAHAASGREGPIEIRALELVRALALSDGQGRELRVRLGRSGAEFHVESRGASGGRWVGHARGEIAALAGEAPVRPLAEIRRRCGLQLLRLEGALPHAHLALGPRFGCLRALGFGEGEMLAVVELPEAFAGDLAELALHPALVEMATSCALALIPDFNPVRDFYLPTGYASVRTWRRLPGSFTCHVRHRLSGDGEGAAVFDATFLDAEGREIVAIDGLAFARCAGAADLLDAAEEGGQGGDEHDLRPATAYMEQEIHVEEGLAALDRLLGHDPPTQLVVAPHPIAGWLDAIALAAEAAARTDPGGIEPALWELTAGARG
jgi:NAD(P)-dependent dehydrogenase (short-subunit alcohol dehydrogenase family)